ncbi:hypothetical protein [Pseudoalteromonas sp. NBT06-2]|uniref:hypothetical protein n=1 Tax=Pseudoalteromonas sp. NBT06-2 TaxID=2025950 RepID=UPI0014828604|nr:hypothetical protein [Pseudoalteromonas sp. NBT06-2]
MESDLFAIEYFLAAIVVLLVLIWIRLEGIFKKIAEIREETGMFKKQFISKDE